MPAIVFWYHTGYETTTWYTFKSQLCVVEALRFFTHGFFWEGSRKRWDRDICKVTQSMHHTRAFSCNWILRCILPIYLYPKISCEVQKSLWLAVCDINYLSLINAINFNLPVTRMLGNTGKYPRLSNEYTAPGQHPNVDQQAGGISTGDFW